MTNQFEGGCQCGAVRYSGNGPSPFAVHCYCRQCQRITGAGHSSGLALPASAVKVSGTLAEYKLKADSGNEVTSTFCPKCGSPVLKRSSGFPDLLFFHAATLDNPALFEPARSVWTARRQPWDGLDANLPVDA